MKKLILYIFFFFVVNTLTAQNRLSFIQVDTSTYSAYLNGNWDKIIEIGTKGLENNIDYYYLRLRIAYAFYMKERYSMAIPHYKKVLTYSNNDAIAYEFLYKCYLYSGRYNDAEKLVAKFPDGLKESMEKQKAYALNNIDFYMTVGSGVNKEKTNEISQTALSIIDGIQTAPNGFKNFNLNIEHRIGRSLIVNHSVNLLNKDSYSWYVKDNITYLSESQLIRQVDYNISADITPIVGLGISPVFSYVNYRIPLYYNYGAGSGRNREVFDYNTYNEFVLGIKVRWNIGIFKTIAAYSHSNLNLNKQNTLSASFSIYPLSNLNLYYTANAYLHLQKQYTSVYQQFIHKHELGGKIHKYLWLEGFLMLGEFNNFYDPYSTIIYNSIERYISIAGINIIVPLYKYRLSLFAGYKYYQTQSGFVPTGDNFNIQNIISINYQTFTGGLSWKF